MYRNNEIFALSLFFSKGIGISNSKIIFDLIEKNTDNFFSKGKELLQYNRFNEKLIQELFSEEIMKKVEKEIVFCENNNIRIIPFFSDEYPHNLASCSDSPILLFQKGNINWNSNKIISIVGTRNITNYGEKILKHFIEDVKIYNPLIVSGLAFGIDIESHKLSLENNLETIAILGNGFNKIYPKEHQKIAERMLENGGICSEFSFMTSPSRENFPRRNRIIAGVCNCLMVIESKIQGGSMITASIANSYSRDIFAVPGRLDDKYSEGCNFLIEKNMANIYTSVKNLEYFLGWETSKPNIVQKEIFLEYSQQEKEVLHQIKNFDKIHIDNLAINLNTTTFKLAPILLELEIKGAVRSIPGKIFSLN